MGADAEYHDIDPLDWLGLWSNQQPPTVIPQRPPQPAFLDAYSNEIDRVTRRLTTDLNAQLWMPLASHFTIDLDGNVKEGDTMSTAHASSHALHARRARLEAELARIEARLEAYGDDIYETGSILVWDKTFVGSPDKVYSYVALRTALGWFVTGRTASTGMTWDALVDFIIDDAVAVPTLYCVTELAEHEPSLL